MGDSSIHGHHFLEAGGTACGLWRIDAETVRVLADLRSILLPLTDKIERAFPTDATGGNPGLRRFRAAESPTAAAAILASLWQKLLIGYLPDQVVIADLMDIGDALLRSGESPRRFLAINQDFLRLATSALVEAKLGEATAEALDAVSRTTFFIIDLVLTAYQAGATEIVAEVELHRSKLALEREVTDLRAAAYIDTLTGLFNRRYFDIAIIKEISRQQRTGQPFALLMLDIDRFKVINDTYGHNRGDVALNWIAHQLKAVSREPDIICRYGGEEFSILLPMAASNTLADIADRFRLAVCRHPARLAINVDAHMTISIGATLHRSGEAATALIARADAALYRAKQNGRNRVEVF